MHPLVKQLMPEYPVVIPQKVVWGEMDAYRHVNNVVYFRYLENVRLEYLEQLDWRRFEHDTGIGPILASIQARFRRPITFPDTLWIGARLLTLEEDRFVLGHRIISEKLGDWTTEGQAVIVTYHYAEARKVPVPEELIRRIDAIEGSV